jgi:hypothetical protein
VAERARAWVCGRLPAEMADSNPVRGRGASLVSVVCFQVEVCALG